MVSAHATTEAMPTVGALAGYSVPEAQRLTGLDEQAAWESAPNAHRSSVIQSWPRAQAAVTWVARMRGRR